MPKKRTYEQLERAFKRAQNKAARTKRAYDSYVVDEATRAKGWRRAADARDDKAADRVAEVEEKNSELKRKLEAATFRADNLYSETEELNDLRQEEETLSLRHRAEAAELNLIHNWKALEASNTVSLGLLDIIQKWGSPVMHIKSEGIEVGSINIEAPDGGPA